MNKVIDARGLACPQPVLLTKKELDNGAVEITTMVDNEAACENLTRLGQNLGCEVSVTNENGCYQVRLLRKSTETVTESAENKSGLKDVVLIASDTFGRGDIELGSILMKSFLYTLSEASQQVSSLIFMNSGVKLACEGSPVLELLQNLSGQGVNIVACGTCLDFYQIKEKLAVGQVTNMYSAWEMMQKAGKVITV